jgi:zinc transport system substrate-binding protein
MRSQLKSLPRRCWTTALPFVAFILQALPSIAAELSVVATIKPVHALVAQVMGATGSPTLLVGGTASPHTFAIKPSDVKKIAGASVVFRVAEAVEPFTAKMVGQLPKGAVLVTLSTVPGIAPLPRRAGGPFEVHGHKGHDHDKHKHTNEAPPGGIDGHVWLDPANGAAMLDAIAATLAAKAPEHAAAYRANATAAKARLDILAKDIAAELAPIAGKPFIIFHDATQYFEKRFGLTVAGSITVDPDVPASGKRLSALRAKVASSGATCVFSEPNFEAKVIAAVIEGSTARTGVLDPEGATLEPGPELYENLLRGMAKSIRGCLAP